MPPECSVADEIKSTSGFIAFIRNSLSKVFIRDREGIIHPLKKQTDKEFILLTLI
jgi:hypothetical protein